MTKVIFLLMFIGRVNQLSNNYAAVAVSSFETLDACSEAAYNFPEEEKKQMRKEKVQINCVKIVVEK